MCGLRFPAFVPIASTGRKNCLRHAPGHGLLLVLMVESCARVLGRKAE